MGIRIFFLCYEMREYRRIYGFRFRCTGGCEGGFVDVFFLMFFFFGEIGRLVESASGRR